MSTQAQVTRRRMRRVIMGLTVAVLFGHGSLSVWSQPRPLTPTEEFRLQLMSEEELRLQQTPPSKRTYKPNRTLRLKQGERFQLGFFLDVLRIESSDAKTVGAWPITPRSVVVEPKEPGKATLTVFTARDIYDKVGEPTTYEVAVEPSSPAPAPAPAIPPGTPQGTQTAS
jgi:hypothetical protein